MANKEKKKCEVCGQESKALWMHMKTHEEKTEVVAQNGENISQVDTKPLICGHDEIVHRTDCKQCWEVEKRYCGKKWLKCGGHGEHLETECQKLCV